MSNLLSSLISSASALSVFERALVVSQNNVSNASTPGYAAQRLNLQAGEFEPDLGLIGGVRAGDVLSARNLFAERAVRRQSESLGCFEQTAQSLAAVEPVFDVSGTQGIPRALNKLFDSFSAWSVEPNSSTARTSVIDRAGELAQSFQQASASLTNAVFDTDRQLRQTVDRVNQLGEDLLEYNAARRSGGLKDAGLDTKIQNSLEELSSLVNFTALNQEDGSVTVLLGGQTPLVIGENLCELRVNFSMPASPPPQYPAAPAPARLQGADGRDITVQVTGGRLGGLLDVRNNVLPSLTGDAYRPGDLNVLAKTVADRVNQLLIAGRVSDGPPAQSGVPLFSYDAGSDAAVAQTLTLDPGITAARLAAIQPGPPYVSNGAALQLAQLASPVDGADKIDGFSYVEYYGQVAGRVGRLLADARDNQDFSTQMVTQAKSLRAELSGVSLDEEAIRVIEFQRAYQANAQMVTVLSDLTQVAIGLLD